MSIFQSFQVFDSWLLMVQSTKYIAIYDQYYILANGFQSFKSIRLLSRNPWHMELVDVGCWKSIKWKQIEHLLSISRGDVCVHVRGSEFLFISYLNMV